MDRLADSFTFRAQAAQINWSAVASRLWGSNSMRLMPSGIDPKTLRRHAMDVHLSWSCGPTLGVPHGPFTVWTRDRTQDKLEQSPVSTFGNGRRTQLWWSGVEASCVQVQCDALDPTRPVGLFLLRTAPQVQDTLAATAVTPGGGSVTIRLRCQGATSAVLVNGTNPVVGIERLIDVVNDPGWKPVEVVGLPVDQPWAGTDYDDADQGPVDNLVSPVEAAVMRLERGGPVIGWGPVTQSGRQAPPWVAPEPKLLVEEVRTSMLPEITGLYDAALREYQQSVQTATRTVQAPQQNGRTSSLPATADLGPWPLLMLPAGSDPFLNLATGFGSAYSIERLDEAQIPVGGSDFLVTADYRYLPRPGRGAGQLAAYSPPALSHQLVADPTGLTAVRAGLIAPATPNAPWRETSRIGWNRVAAPAAIGGVTESSVARLDATTVGVAETLLPARDSGGLRPLVISPDAPEKQPGNDRTGFSDGAAEIPLGSGGRQVGYAVATSDVYGVWSQWRDVLYSGDEPAPQPPRLVSVELTTSYAGSPNCPAELDTEIAVEWLERTPSGVEVDALFFPMAGPTSTPPAWSPGGPTPAGCFRRPFGITFAGDVPTGISCEVLCLDPDGAQPMSPGPGQGDGGRRYALHLPVPELDFGGTGRWGVQLFTRRMLPVPPSPSAWSPDASRPAITSAASPVPVIPLPPPAPPGVPLGSTPDAQGCSHVRVHWTLAAGSDVRTVVVWEASEASIRQRCGLPTQSTDSPGVRLATLWNSYDGMTDTQRRNAFRRILQLPGDARDTDFTLPKGSTDIHLFVVTTVTGSGVDSPWPSGAVPHQHLQAVTAPRLRRPAPPLPRSGVADDGTVTISLQTASDIPVRAFRLLRTKSENAARSADTMGPAFVEVTADAVPATVDTVTGTPIPAIDPVSGLPVVTATWTGSFPSSWDQWLVRAVALPVDTVPVQAVRGLPSQASDVLVLMAPPAGPPDLAPLTAELTSADGRGVVIRTSTTAPDRATSAGSHRLTATAGTQVLPATALESLAQTSLTTPPTAADTAIVPERGVRAAGNTELALWFTRPVAADPVDILVRLIDPFGRSTDRTLTVPGYVAPSPVTLSVIRTVAIAGRGVSVELVCDADPTAAPPDVLQVHAAQRRRLPVGGGPVLPRAPLRPAGPLPGPLPGPILNPAGHGPIVIPGLFGRTLDGSFPFDAIPDDSVPPPAGNRIQVVRHSAHGTAQGDYGVWIPLTAPLVVTFTVLSPDGATVTATTTA